MGNFHARFVIHARFDGQECSSYYMATYIDDLWHPIAYFEGIEFCRIQEFIWLDNESLIVKRYDHGPEEKAGQLTYEVKLNLSSIEGEIQSSFL